MRTMRRLAGAAILLGVFGFMAYFTWPFALLILACFAIAGLLVLGLVLLFAE